MDTIKGIQVRDSFYLLKNYNQLFFVHYTVGISYTFVYCTDTVLFRYLEILHKCIETRRLFMSGCKRYAKHFATCTIFIVKIDIYNFSGVSL